jgi:hypothetical protein
MSRFSHDSYIFGDGMTFHHNWVRNLNDDGIAVPGDARTKNAKIFCKKWPCRSESGTPASCPEVHTPAPQAALRAGLRANLLSGRASPDDAGGRRLTAGV